MENHFPNNLKFLRNKLKMTQEDLAKRMDKDYSTIGKWELGQRNPIMADMLKLADIFNIEVQDLFKTDLRLQNQNNNTFNEKEVFAKNLKYYMEYYKKDRNDICKDLDLPYTTVTDWYNAITYPRIDKIEMLANYFNIQKSDLIEDKYRNQNNTFNELEMLFLSKIKDLPEDKQRLIINVTKSIIEEVDSQNNNE